MARFDCRLIAAGGVVAVACSIPPESSYVGAPCTAEHLYLDATSGHCYRFEPTQLSWSAAESDCVTWGGHLASINGADEQAFVANIITSELPDSSPSGDGAWIGLTNTITPPVYAWSTGEPLTFVDWGQTSPTGKPCVFEYTAKFASHWDDFVCSVQASYVCEK